MFAAEGFDPRASTRRFVLMMPDLVADLLLPPLVERVGAAAQGVRLDVAPWPGSANVTSELARSVDLIIACVPDAFRGFHRQRIYVDADALAVRRAHPAGARLSRLDAFRAARHIAVIAAGGQEDMIDAWLREHGVERHIALAVPSYLQALRTAARTDLVAFVPRRLIAALAGPLGLCAIKPPIDPGVDEQFMFYPTRAQVDPGAIWLRGLVKDIARSLDRRVA
jgi:DNA-binding transcriptional LysR family regulator